MRADRGLPRTLRTLRAGCGAVALGVALLSGAGTARAGAYEDFFDALRRDDAATVRGLLQRGFDANAVDPAGTPALVLAMRDKAFAVGRELAAQPGIDLERRGPVDETALMVAAHQGNLEAVRMLVARGAQVNRVGWAPLHYAATGGHVEVARFLLEESAYIDAESPNGTTPLMMAARHKQMTVLRLLVDEGADPTLRNQAGLTAADYLERLGEEDAAQRLRARADAFRQRHPTAGRPARQSPTGSTPAAEPAGVEPARLPGERPAAVR